MFFWNSLTFSVIQQMLEIWSLILLLFTSGGKSFYIGKFVIHVLLKPCLKDFEHYLASMWNECNYMIVWTSFGIALLWDCNENWPFPVLWPLLSFPDLLTYWVQHFKSNILGFEIAQLEFHHLHLIQVEVMYQRMIYILKFCSCIY